MTTELTLQEAAISKTNKLCTVLVANSLILAVCILGYSYLPDIIHMDPRGISKLLAVVVMAPAIALAVTITIALRQPRHFRANADGITLGTAIAGNDVFHWRDISDFSLNRNSKVLKFRVENLQIKETLRLKQFGITEQQCEQLQLLALSGLQSK